MRGLEPGSQNLTGVWSGLYSKAGLGRMIAFTATLIDSGAGFSGSTHETRPIAGAANATLRAFLAGAKDGRRVEFIKTYDGTAGWSHDVAYLGTISADGTEIEGVWDVRGGLSGRFLMARPARKALQAVQSQLERA